jgi:hypothetical protein
MLAFIQRLILFTLIIAGAYAGNEALPPPFKLPPILFFAVVPLLVLLLWALVQRILDWNLDRQLQKIGMRRWRRWQFAWWLVPTGMVQRLAGSLDDQSLLGAWHLPEHTSSAKAMIADVLTKRGYSSEQLNNWLPSASQCHVPPTVGYAVPMERYLSMVRARGRFSVVCWGIVVFTAIAGVFEQGTKDASSLRDINDVAAAALGIGTILGFIVIAISTWHERDRALRLLLLRPFGTSRISKSVKRLVFRHLGPYGFVYTLEDRYYKHNWVYLFLLKGFSPFFRYVRKQPALLSVIRSERSYVKLGLQLARKWHPSLASLMNGGQGFTVRSTDVWWQQVINLLINSSDIVFVDVSQVGKGTAWEITQLEARRLLGKCLFMVEKGQESIAMEAFNHLLPATLVPKLFVYEESGRCVDEAAYTAALTEHMKVALAAWGMPATQPAAEGRIGAAALQSVH